MNVLVVFSLYPSLSLSLCVSEIFYTDSEYVYNNEIFKSFYHLLHSLLARTCLDKRHSSRL